MSEKLKPCPYCDGGIEITEERYDVSDHGCDWRYSTTFQCKVCGKSISVPSSKKDALEQWDVEATEIRKKRGKDARIKELEGLLKKAESEMFSICDSCDDCDFEGMPDCSAGKLYHEIKSALEGK